MAHDTTSGPLVLAHRGVSSEFPENTIPAFRAARFHGADGVELDVRRTADHSLVVHHDARLADGRAIIETRSVEIPAEVPRLAEALDACEGMFVNIEIKNMPGEPDFDESNAAASIVVDAVRAAQIERRTLVSSFNLSTIDRVHQLAPQLLTGWLLFDFDVEEAVARAVDHGHGAIHPFVGRTSVELIERAHDHGLRVNTWTVDDPLRIEQLAKAGVDAVITNVPALARQAIAGGQ